MSWTPSGSRACGPFTLPTIRFFARLDAEFMDHSGDAGKFTSLAVIRKWIENPCEYRAGDTVAFCDFAGGGAENVLAIAAGTG